MTQKIKTGLQSVAVQIATLTKKETILTKERNQINKKYRKSLVLETGQNLNDLKNKHPPPGKYRVEK